MKKVYECDDAMLAGHVLSLLQGNAIACHVRNLSLTSGIGELPINECWPEVWVNDARDEMTARQLIEAALSEVQPGTDWHCQCGEFIQGQFGTCWSCGSDRPE
ncbi:MAG: DUF2007 domain-containing protein [Gammaproteobacteria bacterium]